MKTRNHDSMIGKSFKVQGQVRKSQHQFRRQPEMIFPGGPFARLLDWSASALQNQVLDFNPTSST
jgi:hypothetical protein